MLDYGCGPGSYIIPLKELVGKEGKIYAVDVHPLAIQMVQNIVLKQNGILSVSDHHMKENEIVFRVANTGLFRLAKMGKRTYSFSREG